MANVEYIQKTLNEFFGSECCELIVAPKNGSHFSENYADKEVPEAASVVSDSEANCPSKGGAEDVER
jgi:hypothetical protein